MNIWYDTGVYIVEYLWIYWTDFCNISSYDSAIGADDGSVPYFPICQGTLPWQPNNLKRNEKLMKAYCILCISVRKRIGISVCAH